MQGWCKDVEHVTTGLYIVTQESNLKVSAHFNANINQASNTKHWTKKMNDRQSSHSSTYKLFRA